MVGPLNWIILVLHVLFDLLDETANGLIEGFVLRLLVCNLKIGGLGGGLSIGRTSNVVSRHSIAAFRVDLIFFWPYSYRGIIDQQNLLDVKSS